jgi:hypothetical protein
VPPRRRPEPRRLRLEDLCRYFSRQVVDHLGSKDEHRGDKSGSKVAAKLMIGDLEVYGGIGGKPL